MSATLLVLVLLVVVAAVLMAAGSVDARTSRRRRRQADIAGTYLAEAGAPHPQPLPKVFIVAVISAASGGSVPAGVGIAGTWADEAQERSDEITGCRSSFNIELISGPTADGLAALSKTGDLRSPEFREAIEGLDVDRMKELSALSRTDPAEFLRICRTEPPT